MKKQKISLIRYLCKCGDLELLKDLYMNDKNIIQYNYWIYNYHKSNEYTYDSKYVSLTDLAFENANMDIIKWIHSIDPNQINKLYNDNQYTFMCLATINNDIETLKFIYSLSPDQIYKQSEDGKIPIFCACEHGYIEIAKWLLSIDQTQIYIIDKYGYDIFSLACCVCNFEIIEWLYSIDHNLINTININVFVDIFYFATNDGNYKDSYIKLVKWMFSIDHEQLTKIEKIVDEYSNDIVPFRIHPKEVFKNMLINIHSIII